MRRVKERRCLSLLPTGAAVAALPTVACWHRQTGEACGEERRRLFSGERINWGKYVAAGFARPGVGKLRNENQTRRIERQRENG